MSTRLSERWGAGVGSTKIDARHRQRAAVVYVRQSTAHQVLHHQESTKVQYSLVERAVELGWPRERVVVIDDDLGQSAARADARPGFQRLVAEVGLDHVGIVLGVEMSRLARSCRDWHHLLEVCALFGTLLSDLDGVYDPSLYNDRLLLGLKGTMSEAELHLMKQRLWTGKLNKAKRGELGMLVPIGYVRRPSGEVVKDPDEQAQAVVRTVFEQFETRATVHGVLCYLVEHGLLLPVRQPTGPDKGALRWSRPNRVTLQSMLCNPIYAGAYVYGRRPTDARAKKPGRPSTGRTVAAMGTWAVCLRDKLPAYIAWEQYEANRRQLASNVQTARGAARSGAALLGGVLRCGRCGMRMAPTYTGGSVRYVCNQARTSYGAPRCQSLAARPLDAHVASLVLRALEPAALEVSLAVATDLEAERACLEAHWRQRLERAQFEVDRATRQYDAVEPENRLVARTLERHLETRLREQQALLEAHRREQAQRATLLTDEERAEVRRLAAEVPALWHAASTTNAQRKAIARQLVERVVVTVEGATERVGVRVEWAGGHVTTTEILRPVARMARLSYYEPLVAYASAMRREGATYAAIAARLNAETSWRPAKGDRFTASMVEDVLRPTRPPQPYSPPPLPKGLLRKNEWTPRALANELAVPATTIYSWLRRGQLKARRVTSPAPASQWAVWADGRELARLRALRLAPKPSRPRVERP
jgi:DNA invertase Pin-like site-specific DNA recombinase